MVPTLTPWRPGPAWVPSFRTHHGALPWPRWPQIARWRQRRRGMYKVFYPASAVGDATVQSGDHQLTDGVAAHGRSEYVHETRGGLMSCAGAAVVSSLQCRHHGAHQPHHGVCTGGTGQVSKVSKRGRSLWMAAGLTCPLLNSSRTYTRGDIERHGDAMKAVRLDDTSCIVFLDVSLYRSCIDRYIML